VIDSATELYGARDLLRNLVARDVRARYKGSALGVFWSLLNPLFMMLIYAIVFAIANKHNKNAPHPYALWFMAGYLPWLFFQTSLQMGASSLLAHSTLLQKVYFPRAVLPISQTFANLANLGFALVVLLPITFIVMGFTPVGMAELVIVSVGLVAFTLGLTLMLSAATVYFRDLEHLIGLLLMAWFFLTPVVFPTSMYPASWLLKFNPATPYVNAFRTVLFDVQRIPLGTLVETIVIGAVTLVVGYAIFNRLQRRIVEEL
jgi:ABC-2 type transport system permease protein